MRQSRFAEIIRCVHGVWVSAILLMVCTGPAKALAAGDGRAITVSPGKDKNPGIIPNSPAPVNSPTKIAFTGAVLANGQQQVTIDYGDLTTGTMVTVMDHANAAYLLFVDHTYTSAGVYTISATYQTMMMPVTVTAQIVVGDTISFNAFNGASVNTTRGGGGQVTLQLGIGSIPGAVTARTVFKTSTGTLLFARAEEGGARDLTINGTTVSTTLPAADIYVAESTVLDGFGNALELLRTTIPISAEDLGSSNPANDKVTFGSMKGKFAFSSSAPDKVDFAGTLVLPAAYDPKAVNTVTIGIGNVLDKVQLDGKGKLIKSSKAFITKLKITAAKVAGTPSKVSFTMNVGDLDSKGFESDGIRKTLKPLGGDKGGRVIQVALLVGSKSYSLKAPVLYKVSSTGSGDFGTLSGRAAK